MTYLELTDLDFYCMYQILQINHRISKKIRLSTQLFSEIPRIVLNHGSSCSEIEFLSMFMFSASKIEKPQISRSAWIVSSKKFMYRGNINQIWHGRSELLPKLFILDRQIRQIIKLFSMQAHEIQKKNELTENHQQLCILMTSSA